MYAFRVRQLAASFSSRCKTDVHAHRRKIMEDARTLPVLSDQRSTEAYAKCFSSCLVPPFFDKMMGEIVASLRRRYGALPIKRLDKMVVSFLYHMILFMRPQRILDLGSFNGPTSVMAAVALKHLGGRRMVDSFEVDSEGRSIAQRYAREQGVADHVQFHDLKGLDLLDELASRNLQYDLIHMDLTKGNYAPTFDKIHQLNLLTKDGALLLENTLYRKPVPVAWLRDESYRHPEAHLFNSYLRRRYHNDYQILILPIMEGISIIRRQSSAFSFSKGVPLRESDLHKVYDKGGRAVFK